MSFDSTLTSIAHLQGSTKRQFDTTVTILDEARKINEAAAVVLRQATTEGAAAVSTTNAWLREYKASHS
jgi:hypothetical protein